MAINPVSLKDYHPFPPLEEQYPVEFMEKRKVIKLHTRKDGSIIIGLGIPDDELLKEELQDFHQTQCEFVKIDNDELAAYLSKELSRQNEGEYDTKESASVIQLDKLANDAPIVNLVNNLFIEAIRSNASDIHIEGSSDITTVRYRIDGMLSSVSKLPSGQFPAISSRIKIMANLNIMERRLPQDGRISLHLGGIDLDMRISIVPIAGGESIVLRLFNEKDTLTSLDQLGFSKKDLSTLKELYSLNNGLILFTGPTGSGKTTSLNAIIRMLDAVSSKIITIEDPVENRIPGVSQIQTNEEIGLSFHSLLRRVLRQDPNIIMIGEIRDSETAQLAVRAALTGHLVLSSLHTNDAVSTINRLRNMGTEPYLLGAVLKGAVAQRLVRKLCPECKKTRSPSPGERKLFLEHGIETEKIYEASGCSVCGNTGYKGRTAVYEIMTVDLKLEKMIADNAQADIISDHLKKTGRINIISSGLRKVVDGETSLAELERVL